MQCSICYSNMHDPHTRNDDRPGISSLSTVILSLLCAVNYSFFFFFNIQAVTQCSNSFRVIFGKRDPRLDPDFVQAGLHLGKHLIHSDDVHKFTPQGVKTQTGTHICPAEPTTTSELIQKSPRNTSSYPLIITGSGMVWTEKIKNTGHLHCEHNPKTCAIMWKQGRHVRMRMWSDADRKNPDMPATNKHRRQHQLTFTVRTATEKWQLALGTHLALQPH